MILEVERAGARHKELHLVSIVQGFDDAWDIFDQLDFVERDSGGFGEVDAQLGEAPFNIGIGRLVKEVPVFDAFEVEIDFIGVRQFVEQVFDGRRLPNPPHPGDNGDLFLGRWASSASNVFLLYIFSEILYKSNTNFLD